jgi:hypothetical protein
VILRRLELLSLALIYFCGSVKLCLKPMILFVMDTAGDIVEPARISSPLSRELPPRIDAARDAKAP